MLQPVSRSVYVLRITSCVVVEKVCDVVASSSLFVKMLRGAFGVTSEELRRCGEFVAVSRCRESIFCVVAGGLACVVALEMGGVCRFGGCDERVKGKQQSSH